MSIKFHVICNALFHFKFSIADCQDGSLDTGVFMEGSSFSSNSPIAIQFSTATVGGDSTIVEGCEAATLNLTRSDTVGDITLYYTIGGTATNGVDYVHIADSVSYLAGIDTASITIIPINDAILEGQESITITTTSTNACGNTVTSSDSIYINDVPLLTIVGANTNDTLLNCPTDSIKIGVQATGIPAGNYTYYWSDAQGNTYPNSPNVFVPSLQTGTFYVTVVGYCPLITVSDTIVVNVTPWYILNSTQSDFNICDGEIVDFSTTPSLIGNYAYNWTAYTAAFGTPTDSATTGAFNTPGTDTITVTVNEISGPLTCIKKDTLLVTVSTIPTVDFPSPDTIICRNGAANLYASPLGDAPPLSLIWNNGLTGNGPHIVNPTADTTTYEVFVLDANNCTSDTHQISIALFDHIKVQTLNIMRPKICAGDTTKLKTTATGGGTSLFYTWLNGNDSIIGATATNEFIITPSYDGEIFSVVVSDSCTTTPDTLSISSDWQNAIYPTYTIDSAVFCYDQYAPVFTNTTVGLANIVNVNWDFGDGNFYNSPYSFPINHSYNAPGVYSVKLTLTDQTGCTWDTIMPNVVVDARSYPVADFSWLPNPTDYLNAELTFDNLSTDNVFNEWLFITDAQYTSNVVDPVFQFPQDQPGSYDVVLKITNEIGCRDSITKTVVIDDVFLFYIPTGFSPNGDGLNDSFKVIGEGMDLANFKLMVFNQWGELIFESNDPKNGWDGTQKGELVPTGTYVWRLDVKEAHSPIMHHKDGHVTITR